MLSIKYTQVDFIDVRVRRLIGDLQDTHARVKLALEKLNRLRENPENYHLTLEQIYKSMGPLLEPLELTL